MRSMSIFMQSRQKIETGYSKQDNLYYDETENYFACPMGQHMDLAYKTKTISDNR